MYSLKIFQEESFQTNNVFFPFFIASCSKWSHLTIAASDAFCTKILFGIEGQQREIPTGHKTNRNERTKQTKENETSREF